MQQDTPVCPGCGATYPSADPPAAARTCQYCGWQLGKHPVPSGPQHFRNLLSQKDNNPDELLDQVPAELREVLAGKLRAVPAGSHPEFTQDTAQALRGMGYSLMEDPHGARLTAVPRVTGAPAALSPSDVVRLAAELDGGVKPRGKLPVCPKCQGLSPIGDSKCQWCGEALPTDPVA